MYSVYQLEQRATPCMKDTAQRFERVCAAWRRFTVFLIRLAGLRRLWKSLGNYLHMIRQRGRQVATQSPRAEQSSSSQGRRRP